MEPKFVVDVHGRHGRSFHTDVEVGRSSIEHFWKRVSVRYDEVYREQGRVVADMISDLLGVDGVESVFVKPYEVSVFLADFPPWRGDWNMRIDDIVHAAFRRLYRETHPREQVLVEKIGAHGKKLHTSFEVSKLGIKHFDRPLSKSDEEELNKVGAAGAELVRRLMSLPGVVQMFIKPYEVTIYIGMAFSWDSHERGKSLDESVEKIFEDIFGPEIAFRPA